MQRPTFAAPLLAALLMLFACPTQAAEGQEAENDFREIRWGMSEKQVRAVEGGRILKQDEACEEITYKRDF